MTRAVEAKNGERVVTDPETGLKIRFTRNQENRLTSLEQQIAMHYVHMALALKEIRDEKLYFLRDCKNMGDYCISCLRMSLRHMYQHLQIADAFSESVLHKLSKSNSPMKSLLLIAKDDDLTEQINAGKAELDDDRVIYSDGTTEPLIEAIDRARDQEKKAAKKKMEDQKRVMEGKDSMIEDYRERLSESEEKINELYKTISDLSSRKDLKPEDIVLFTHKKEALRFLEDAEGKIIKLFGDLSGIPHTLCDAELTARLALVVAAIEAGVQRIREEFGTEVWLPGERPGTIPVVPS